MSGSTVEQVRPVDAGTGLGGAWHVIVKNDDHNTFQHVARTLARVIPSTSVEDGFRLAELIDRSGLAIVWTGHRELAEHYRDQLQQAGLTMAPLERA